MKLEHMVTSVSVHEGGERIANLAGGC